MTEVKSEITPSPKLTTSLKKRKFEETGSTYIQNRFKKRKTEKDYAIGTYIIGPVLGEGSYGKVFQGKEIATGKMVAIKKIPIQQETKEMEVKIMQLLARGNKCDDYFLCLIRVFEDKKYIYLVSEYLDKYIRVMDFIQNQSNYSSEIKKKVICNLIKAIELLQKENIAHNDLHDENIMVNPTTGQIKIIDFGWAEIVKSQNAPGIKTDMWKLYHHAQNLGYTGYFDLNEKGITSIKKYAC